MTRNYRKERQAYYGYGSASSVTAEQRRHRDEMASRQKAGAKVKKTRKIPRGKEVDHKDGNPKNNKSSNLQVISRRDMPDSVESKILSHPDTVPEVEVKVEPPETPPPPCP